MPSSVRDPIPRASISPGVTYTKCAVTQTALSGGGRAVCMASCADASRARARARRRGSLGTRSSSLWSTWLRLPPSAPLSLQLVQLGVSHSGFHLPFLVPQIFPLALEAKKGGDKRQRS